MYFRYCDMGCTAYTTIYIFQSTCKDLPVRTVEGPAVLRARVLADASRLQVDFWNAVPTDLAVEFPPGVVMHPRIKVLFFIGISSRHPIQLSQPS